MNIVGYNVQNYSIPAGPELWGTLLVPWSGHVWDNPKPVYGHSATAVCMPFNNVVVNAQNVSVPSPVLATFAPVSMMSNPGGKS